MNLISIVKELEAEKAQIETTTAELVERIDAHIQDFLTLRAWIVDFGKARVMTVDGILNGAQPPAQPELPFSPDTTK